MLHHIISLTFTCSLTWTNEVDCKFPWCYKSILFAPLTRNTAFEWNLAYTRIIQGGCKDIFILKISLLEAKKFQEAFSHSSCIPLVPLAVGISLHRVEQYNFQQTPYFACWQPLALWIRFHKLGPWVSLLNSAKDTLIRMLSHSTI